MSSIVIGTILGAAINLFTKPIIPTVQAEESVVLEKPVMIEVTYDWDIERVKEEILKVFPDAPVMVKVAACESGFNIHAVGPTHDRGIFQVIDSWAPTANKLGLNDYKTNPRSNILMARYLYDHGGLNPWNASRYCWGK